MIPALERARTLAHRLRVRLRLRHWFPHVPLAALSGLGGFRLLQDSFGAAWRGYLDELARGSLHLAPILLPPLLIGGGLLAMALGLLLRSRVAWTMTLLLLATGAASRLFAAPAAAGPWLLAYFLAVLAALAASWRAFDRSSMAASTLFAVTAVAMLLIYATFGSYYIGADFRPPIRDLTTALYYAMVTMSTVGYGDITPDTPRAELFAVSLIVLGVAVFATSLTAVIAPIVGNSLQRIVNRKDRAVTRENHFIVIGDTPLAINTWRELARRGRAVTRVLREAPPEGSLPDVDVIVGDPSSEALLLQAGVRRATAVLAMLADDSENAFVTLAVKAIGGPARTIAAVNDARHLSRVRLVQPDLVIAPQVLGGELMAMMLAGEQVTADFIMQRVFMGTAPTAAADPAAGAGEAG